MQRILPAIFVFLLCAFSACKKSSDQPVSRMMVINGSINSSGLDVKAGADMVISNVGFGTSSGYQKVNSGSQQIAVLATGTTTALSSGTLNFNKDASYTLVASDSVGQLKVTLLADNLTAPSSTQSGIRFLHLSNNAGPVDVRQGTTTLFASRSFNDHLLSNTAGTFVPFNTIAGVPLDITIFIAGTNILRTSIPGVVYQPGKLYTLVMRGNTGAAGNAALALALFNNN